MTTLVITRDRRIADRVLGALVPGKRVCMFSPAHQNAEVLRGHQFDVVLVELGVKLPFQLEDLLRLCVMAGRTPESRIAELEARVRELEAAK